MHTRDLATLIADQHGMLEQQVRDVLRGLLDGTAKVVATGEEVSLLGFGQFKMKDRPERDTRHPSTGEVMTIAASKKLTFTPAKALKVRL